MHEPIESLRHRLQDKPTADVQSEVRTLVLEHRDRRGGHRELGLLCEQAGLMGLALGEFQLALRDDSEDSIAAFHLAQHYRERGDATRALALLERLLAAEPLHPQRLRLYVEILIEEGAQPRALSAIERAVEFGLDAPSAAALRRLVGPDAPPQDQPAERRTKGAVQWVPADADCVRFHTLFSGREGVYARQWAKRGGEGGYSPVHEPLTPAIIRNHLLGTYTVGVYPVRLDATATFFALDLDINKTALQRATGDHPFAQSLRQILQQEGPRLLHVLRDLELTPLFENSGYKGRHYWVFLEQPETAATLHLLGRLLLRWQTTLLPAHLHLEFFPKQERLTGKGLGNLIKLPLGIHRRTGHRSTLLDDRGVAVDDPMSLLRGVRLVPRRVVHAAIEYLKGLARDQVDAPAEAAEEAPPATGKASAGAPATLPDRLPVWTEADFETDLRVRHMLNECAVLAELKRMVDEYRQLSHDEQIVLIHSLGHVEGGPQAVNYLLEKCVDVGPEKFMKSRLKGNPVSCPSIRKKIPHVTRRVACNCAFECAKDRYPTPTLHLLTLAAPASAPAPQASPPSLVATAQRFAVLECRKQEILRQCNALRDAFMQALRSEPDQRVTCPNGAYRIVMKEGVEELVWEPDAQEPPRSDTPPTLS